MTKLLRVLFRWHHLKLTNNNSGGLGKFQKILFCICISIAWNSKSRIDWSCGIKVLKTRYHKILMSMSDPVEFNLQLIGLCYNYINNSYLFIKLSFTFMTVANKELFSKSWYSRDIRTENTCKSISPIHNHNIWNSSLRSSHVILAFDLQRISWRFHSIRKVE